MVVTKELILKGMSGNGGWNAAQLRILGIEYPPRSGWMDRVSGKVLSDDDVQTFLDLRGKTKKALAKGAKEIFPADYRCQCGSDSIPLAVFVTVEGEQKCYSQCRSCFRTSGNMSMGEANELKRQGKLRFIEECGS